MHLKGLPYLQSLWSWLKQNLTNQSGFQEKVLALSSNPSTEGVKLPVLRGWDPSTEGVESRMITMDMRSV